MIKEKRLEVYNEIAKEIKEKYDTDISIEEVHSIVESQFKIMAYGFSKGVGIALPVIGKFVPFDMDYYSEKIIIPNKKLQAELREEGQDNAARKAYVDSYVRYKDLIKELNGQPVISAEALMVIPNIDGSTDELDIFKNLR